MIARKDISTAEILAACDEFHRAIRLRSALGKFQFLDSAILYPAPTPDVALAGKYPVKVILAKMKKLHRAGLIEYGVSLRTAWTTTKGKEYGKN